MTPPPVAGCHSVRSLKKNVHTARGYQCACSQARQRLIRKRPCAAASQNGLVSSVGTGDGMTRSCAFIDLLPFHDYSGAAVPGGEHASRAVCQTEPAVGNLDLRVGFAAQLPDRFDHLGHDAAICWMVIAQA